jgi:general secretion pathway protein G
LAASCHRPGPDGPKRKKTDNRQIRYDMTGRRTPSNYKVCLKNYIVRFIRNTLSTIAIHTAARRLDLSMNCQNKRRPAFSLMELIAVVAILGIIAALIVPRIIGGSDTAKDKACFHNRAEINITVEQFYLHNSSWPANNLSDIGADTNYFPDGLPTCPVTGQPYRLDPVTHRVVGHENSSDHNP